MFFVFEDLKGQKVQKTLDLWEESFFFFYQARKFVHSKCCFCFDFPQCIFFLTVISPLSPSNQCDPPAGGAKSDGGLHRPRLPLCPPVLHDHFTGQRMHCCPTRLSVGQRNSSGDEYSYFHFYSTEVNVMLLIMNTDSRPDRIYI